MITPLLTAALSCAAFVAPGEVVWFEADLGGAAARARAEDKPMLVALLPEWSDYSRMMATESLVDADVQQLLEGMVCVRFEEEDDASREVVTRYNVVSFPTLILTAPDGSIDDVIIGYFPPAPLASELRRIANGQGTLRDHLRRVAGAPYDLAVRYAYAVKLDELGDRAGYRRELDTILAQDPAGTTFIGNVVQQQDLWAQIAAAATGGERTYELAPLHVFLDASTEPQALFQGWSRVANFEVERERRMEAIEAFAKARPHVPEGPFLDWADQVVNFVIEADQGDLPPEAGAFATELAKDLVARGLELGTPDENGEIAFPFDDWEGWFAGRLDLLTRCSMKWPDAVPYEDALANARRALELDPANPDYRSRLALLEERR